MQFGPMEHRGGDDNNNNSYIALYPVKSHKLEVIMTTTTTPTPKASDDVTDHGHQTKKNKRYRYDRRYMGLNVTVMTGVTWARTLPLRSMLQGLEHYC